MYLSRIAVQNFRNFQDLDLVDLPPSLVIAGENNVGKSNLLHALRLVLDPFLPDGARSLKAEDFWRGLDRPFAGHEIAVTVEVRGFDGDETAESVLTDFLVGKTPLTARLRYLYRPRPSARPDAPQLADTSERDYEFVVDGGPHAVRKTPDVRRVISMRTLSALRDVEDDLQTWTKSPLRSLLLRLDVPSARLTGLASAMQDASRTLLEEPSVAELEASIRASVKALAGPSFALDVALGVASSRADQVLRSVRLLVDDGRPLAMTGLGSKDLLFLALLLQDLSQRRASPREASWWVLAVEEPEAHLHPHLQRVVFDYLLHRDESLVLTTHSPQVVSVTPIDSLVFLRRAGGATVAKTVHGSGLDADDKTDIERYLDAIRSDFLFARGVILVEGSGELYLVPAFAKGMGHNLDELGITVCSVQGTQFQPYRQLLGPAALSIPHVIITDGDPSPDPDAPAGLARGVALLEPDKMTAGETALSLDGHPGLRELLEGAGLYVGDSTLEADVAVVAGAAMASAFAELVASDARRANFSSAINNYQASQSIVNRRALMSRIEGVGKGRFAQRMAAHLDGIEPPDYVRRAIQRIVDDVIAH
jgi:putative ATP-dependent endonuclease of the OLD family